MYSTVRNSVVMQSLTETPVIEESDRLRMPRNSPGTDFGMAKTVLIVRPSLSRIGPTRQFVRCHFRNAL